MTRHQRNLARARHLGDRAAHHLIARPLVAVVFLDRTASASARLLRAGLRRLDPDYVVCDFANRTGDES